MKKTGKIEEEEEDKRCETRQQFIIPWHSEGMEGSSSVEREARSKKNEIKKEQSRWGPWKKERNIGLPLVVAFLSSLHLLLSSMLEERERERETSFLDRFIHPSTGRNYRLSYHSLVAETGAHMNGLPVSEKRVGKSHESSSTLLVSSTEFVR